MLSLWSRLSATFTSEELPDYFIEIQYVEEVVHIPAPLVSCTSNKGDFVKQKSTKSMVEQLSMEPGAQSPVLLGPCNHC